jgi:hypothetical protein
MTRESAPLPIALSQLGMPESSIKERKMLVTFMVDGMIEKEAEMDAVPRVGETVWLNLTRATRTTYEPGKVTAVDWHGSDRAELRISTGR